jgi:sucrose phosphorylase
MISPKQRIHNHLALLYGEDSAPIIESALWDRINAFNQRYSTPPVEKDADSSRFSEKDALLITYGNQFQQPGQTPLQTLASFLEHNLREAFNGVHILPFFPFTSDDGFSVVDYREVNPQFGSWEDIAQIGCGFRLMFDAVINHISSQSAWYQSYLRQEPPFDQYFIEVDPNEDLSKVFRPRALPLLTRAETSNGTRFVWSTFSEDQLDLNYANPKVMLEILDLLLFYVERGASLIRLDAIAYLWKEIGTSCIHLPKTHEAVKLMRAVLDAASPQTLIITETNVPHKENISYFGQAIAGSHRSDEAQLVYQFPLAPLLLHTFRVGDASILRDWAASLQPPYPSTTFFNFTASHDGIGVMPARGLIDKDDLEALVQQTIHHGGQVSYKSNEDGSKSVYELNTTWYDAINPPAQADTRLGVSRFLASQTVMLSLAGVPGVYVHSLFGSRNCHTCVQESGRARSINRQVFQMADLRALLANPSRTQTQVFRDYCRLLRIRRQQTAFHPNASQEILQNLPAQVFGLLRVDAATQGTILCLVNCSSNEIDLELETLPDAAGWQDLIGGLVIETGTTPIFLHIDAYQSMWLKAD